MSSLNNLQKLSDSDLRKVLQNSLDPKTYQKFNIFCRQLGYKDVVEMFQVNSINAIDSLTNPNNLNNADWVIRMRNLESEFKQAGVFNLKPLIRYFRMKRTIKYVEISFAKLMTQLIHESPDTSIPEEIMTGVSRINIYAEITGYPVSKNERIIKGLNELVLLQEKPKSSDVMQVPLFELDKNGHNIPRIACSLFDRGLIDSIDQFEYLFIPEKRKQDVFEKPINWKSTLGTLIYLFLVLGQFEVISAREHFDMNSKLKYFHKGDKPISSSKKSIDIEKRRISKNGDLARYSRSAKNKDYRIIYNIVSTIVERKSSETANPTATPSANGSENHLD